NIVAAANGGFHATKCFLPDPNASLHQEFGRSLLQPDSSFAYLKISEGCDRHCTYCIIPKLRGRQKSRSLHRIVSEAQELIASGIKEIILIAQDSTAYGKDLRPSLDIGILLETLSEKFHDVWFRVLYGHPESIDEHFIQTVAGHSNVCSYFDIPIQHSSNLVLKKMGRNYTEDDLYRLFDNIRTVVPGASIRTTIITGFPGETEADCQRLLDFMNHIRFDHLGVFIYSDSNDLASHRLPDHVDKKTAQARYDRLMFHQKKISFKNNKNHIGRLYDAIVEEKIETGLYSGRTYFQAPEVDGITYIYSSEPFQPGSFVRVTVTDALEYDLVSEPE
ncbi:MAG: MiaB/RimO family radical SAM methylthiotransferase, partial [Deltaproteobacteria bacterium]|nr:MiaB/RimO family radical SAM methylthiotransferase [Deltaproteobacteria bacterium]